MRKKIPDIRNQESVNIPATTFDPQTFFSWTNSNPQPQTFAFDRGHMVPNGDMQELNKDATFHVLNRVPQVSFELSAVIILF